MSPSYPHFLGEGHFRGSHKPWDTIEGKESDSGISDDSDSESEQKPEVESGTAHLAGVVYQEGQEKFETLLPANMVAGVPYRD